MERKKVKFFGDGAIKFLEKTAKTRAKQKFLEKITKTFGF